jgi:hypothetical protein
MQSVPASSQMVLFWQRPDVPGTQAPDASQEPAGVSVLPVQDWEPHAPVVRTSHRPVPGLHIGKEQPPASAQSVTQQTSASQTPERQPSGLEQALPALALARHWPIVVPPPTSHQSAATQSASLTQLLLQAVPAASQRRPPEQRPVAGWRQFPKPSQASAGSSVLPSQTAGDPQIDPAAG